jgi:hypothetical protein
VVVAHFRPKSVAWRGRIKRGELAEPKQKRRRPASLRGRGQLSPALLGALGEPRRNPIHDGLIQALSRLLRLTLLAPEIVEAILDGRSLRLQIENLLRPMPVEWERQKATLGFLPQGH